MEAGLDADAFIQMFAASMAANVFTAMAVIGVVMFSRYEKRAKEEGRKLQVPPFVYALILMPAAFAAVTLYYVS